VREGKIEALRIEIEVEQDKACTFVPDMAVTRDSREKADKRRTEIRAEAQERAAAIRKQVPNREAKNLAELQKKHKARAMPAVSAEIAGCMEVLMPRAQRAKSVERRRK
jgi:hypothetical protein